MVKGRSQGLLRWSRGGGSLIRVLLFALALQILTPLLGVFPDARAAAPAESISICTAHGIVTLVPDGQGGWTEQQAPQAAGLSCSFCLPLLSGAVGPVAAVAEPIPVPAEHGFAPPLALPVPAAALPPGTASPRAPPSHG